MEIISIHKTQLPYKTTIRLGKTSFTFVCQYNLIADLFTVDLMKGDEILAIGEPLIYGTPLFGNFYDERFPKCAFIPFDPSEKVTRVGWHELGESVFLYLVWPEDIENV